MKFKKMSDEQLVDKLIEMLSTRLSVTTGFAREDVNGNLTHQYLIIKAGDVEVVSAPEQLELPLRLATPEEQGASVN